MVLDLGINLNLVRTSGTRNLCATSKENERRHRLHIVLGRRRIVLIDIALAERNGVAKVTCTLLEPRRNRLARATYKQQRLVFFRKTVVLTNTRKP